MIIDCAYKLLSPQRDLYLFACSEFSTGRLEVIHTRASLPVRPYTLVVCFQMKLTGEVGRLSETDPLNETSLSS